LSVILIVITKRFLYRGAGQDRVLSVSINTGTTPAVFGVKQLIVFLSISGLFYQAYCKGSSSALDKTG